MAHVPNWPSLPAPPTPEGSGKAQWVLLAGVGGGGRAVERVPPYPVAADNHGNCGELLGCPSHLLDCMGARAWPGPRVHQVEQWEVGGALSQGTLLAAPGRYRRAPVPRLSRMLARLPSDAAPARRGSCGPGLASQCRHGWVVSHSFKVCVALRGRTRLVSFTVETVNCATPTSAEAIQGIQTKCSQEIGRGGQGAPSMPK